MKGFMLLLGAMLVSTVSLAVDPNDALLTIAPGTWYGCYDMGLKMKIDDHALQGEKETYRKELKTHYASGMCIFFFGGQKVFISDTNYLDLGLLKVVREEDLEKILRKEEVTEYWLNKKALLKRDF